jgi:hypothetical protein
MRHHGEDEVVAEATVDVADLLESAMNLQIAGGRDC